MKKLILGVVLLLSACCQKPTDTGLATWPHIPDLPKHLSDRVVRLEDLNDPSMGALLLDSVAVDRKYNDLGNKYNGLIDVYNCVKDSLNTKQDPNKCFK